jgi:hypothetical protein
VNIRKASSAWGFFSYDLFQNFGITLFLNLNDAILVAPIRYSGESQAKAESRGEFHSLDNSLHWYDVRRFSQNRFAQLRLKSDAMSLFLYESNSIPNHRLQNYLLY